VVLNPSFLQLLHVGGFWFTSVCVRAAEPCMAPKVLYRQLGVEPHTQPTHERFGEY
jgi:hypothetical protein